VNDRRLLAVGSDDARIRLVDPHSGDIVAGPFGTPQRAGLQSMLRCGVVDGRPFATVTSDSTFRIFHLDDGSQRTLVDENPERAMITGIACYHLSGRPVLVITDRLGNLQMWDVRSTRIRKVRAQAHPHGPTGLICVETDKEPLLITGGPEGRLLGWSAVDLSPRPEVNAVHSGGVRGLIAAEKAFTSIGHDGSRKTWDANSGALLGTSTDAEPVVFELDGERIVNVDGTLVRLAGCSSDRSSWPLGSWDDLPRTESLSFSLKLRGTLL
jgi:WD40 repeat protein